MDSLPHLACTKTLVYMYERPATLLCQGVQERYSCSARVYLRHTRYWALLRHPMFNIIGDDLIGCSRYSTASSCVKEGHKGYNLSGCKEFSNF